MLAGDDDGGMESEKMYARKKSFKDDNSSSSLREHQQGDQAMISEGKRSISAGFDMGSDNFSALRRCGPGGKSGFMRHETRVRISLSMKSKHEARELKRKLEGERDMVRILMRKIEANEVQKSMPVGVGPPRMSKPMNQLSVSVPEKSRKANENPEKEKRTPKANNMYRNSDFLLAKDKIPGNESNKKLKSNPKKVRGSESGKFPNQAFKSCQILLDRLMKHKHAWVFNKPVDAVGLGLLDYFEVIKNPMDLGTVKNRLSQNWYNAPVEFAEDVRLTFRNAMTYNPKEQDVYLMADQLAKIFEEKWARVEADYTRELKHVADVGPPAPIPRKAPLQKAPQQPRVRPDVKNLVEKDRAESKSLVEPKGKSTKIVQPGRVPVPKKPKAKDPNKREMTYDEKQKLSINLQSLPSEKLESVVNIIKKRNPSLTQQDDEIEVDIDVVDTETLWELDRFIGNFKKSERQNKRKAESVVELPARPEQIVHENVYPPMATEPPKDTADEESVVASPVQVNERVDNDTNQGGSQSSSSGDTGSSSSDSDGESSSKDESAGGKSTKDPVVEIS